MKAVFFDVDFTLIYPGPVFRGEGYRDFCARYGIEVDPSRFEQGVAHALPLLDVPADTPYDAEIFARYTGRIIEYMGGTGPHVATAAREIYDEWATNQHFELYDDVDPVLRAVAARGLRIGLISNSHRCLASFASHFALEGLFTATVSSSEHGLMKPHPSIFTAALARAGVDAGDALMVGDSYRADIEGALGAGLRAVLLHRSIDPSPHEATLAARGVPIIRSLHDLLPLVD